MVQTHNVLTSRTYIYLAEFNSNLLHVPRTNQFFSILYIPTVAFHYSVHEGATQKLFEFQGKATFLILFFVLSHFTKLLSATFLTYSLFQGNLISWTYIIRHASIKTFAHSSLIRVMKYILPILKGSVLDF